MIEQLKTIRAALTVLRGAVGHEENIHTADLALTALTQLEAMVGESLPSFQDDAAVDQFLTPARVITLSAKHPAALVRGLARRAASLTAAPVAQQPQKLEEIEQYRMQIAGICTAAIGYWKEGDPIHPAYDTPALRDVARLYAKYDALYKAQQPQAEAVPLRVFYRSMPESCGRTNWTASLFVKGRGDFTIARSEYPHRVRYDADCVRWLIGELDEKPFILDYDGDEATPCHLCGGIGEVDGKPCHGLNFKGTVHHAAPQQAEAVPHLFELWWAEYMPEATQARAWAAWVAAPRSDGVGVAAPQQAEAVPSTHVLVPVEPTAGMCKAAADAWLDCGSRLVLNKAGAAVRAAIAQQKGAKS